MGFIENPLDYRAAIQNGWLDEQGLVTTEFVEVARISATLPDPWRPVGDVLREEQQHSLREQP